MSLLPEEKNLGFSSAPKTALALLMAVVLLGVLLFLPEEESGLPPPQNDRVITLPQERVIGFLKAGGGPSRSDQTRPSHALFDLPAVDTVIEYEYLSESPIRVTVDQSLVEEIPANTTGWRKRVILSRDVLGGTRRVLGFRNRAPGKRWGLNYAVTHPVSRREGESLISALRSAVAEAEGFSQSRKALVLLLNEVHRSIIELLRESNIDAVDYPVVAERELPDGVQLELELQSVLTDREQNSGKAAPTTALKTLLRIASSLDSELWRRTSLGLHQAQRFSQNKKHVEAYDELMGIISLFPEDSTDYRVLLANRLLNDKNFIPKKVRENPGKFRKQVTE